MIYSTDNPLPYSQGQYAGVHIDSTPEEVTELLGQPHLKLQGGDLWVYGRTRVVVRSPPDEYHDFKAILVQFSSGVVTTKSSVHRQRLVSEACWSKTYGPCLWPVWEPRSSADDDHSQILSRTYSAVTSRGEEDEQAKRFKPDDSRCGVYIFSSRNFFRDSRPPVVSIGTARDEPVPAGGYLKFQFPPQRLQLVAGRNTMDIDCQAGALHFYRVVRYLVAGEDNIFITSFNTSEGIRAIKSRHLLLTW